MTHKFRGVMLSNAEERRYIAVDVGKERIRMETLEMAQFRELAPYSCLRSAPSLRTDDLRLESCKITAEGIVV